MVNEELILDELLGSLRLDRIHAAMVATDWKWIHEGGEMRVPTVDEIRSRAREIAADCLKAGRGVAGAGFFASIFKDADGERILELSFSLDDASVRIE